jgi:putative ABC transport system substrate-binding protein
MRKKQSSMDLRFLSGNLKSKIQNLKWMGIFAIVFTFAFCGAVGQAQQAKKVHRIGYLSAGTSSSEALRLEAFREGLRQRGYVEGQNIIIEVRYAEGRPERLPDLAADLVRLKVDVIVTGGTLVRAAKDATSTIPIVMLFSSDPVGNGLVASLARPGGNVTGLSSMAVELGGKRLELFKEAFPKVRRPAVLWQVTSDLAFSETQTAAQALGLKIRPLELRGPEDFDGVFAVATKERLDGLFTVASAFLTANRKRIVEFALKNKLPAMYHNEDFIEAGGLMTYAPSLLDMHRRAATYVDKILKGTKPSDLPVEQPMKFELIISLKTAKQIGVTIPPNFLVRANKVIR